MKISVDQKSLLSAVEPCAEVAGKPSNSVLSLQSLRLTSGKDGGLVIDACDGSVHATSICDASGDAGSACVGAESFLRAIKVMPADQLSIEWKDDGRVLISCGAIKTKIPITSDPQDFPRHNQAPFGANQFDDILSAFQRMGWAIPPKHENPSIMGMIVVPQEDGVHLFCTNTHVLLRSRVAGDLEGNLVLDPRLANAARPGMSIGIDRDEKLVTVGNATLSVTSGLGPKPFDAVTWADKMTYESEVEVDRTTLSNAINRAKGYVDDKGKRSTVIVDKGELTVKASNNKGDYEESIAVSGEDSLKFAVNLGYLDSSVRSLKYDALILKCRENRFVSLVSKEEPFEQAHIMALHWDIGDK